MLLGDLRKELALWPDDTEIIFGLGDLSFSKPKQRHDGLDGLPVLLQIEFNELYQVTDSE